jgi:transposase
VSNLLVAEQYEAWIDLGDERTKVQIFAMRSMASGAAFHRAYLHATQQAFLEAHEHAFAYFGGVFPLLRYDNLASAVRKILRGYRREETVWFMAFRSHWRFAAEFCTPGEGHEKGALHHRDGADQRTRRGGACQSTQSCIGPMGTARPYLY